MTALVVRRPAAVSLDSLVDALWGCNPPPSARKTVQKNVLRVRSKLGRAAIETVGDGYRLGVRLETDLERFERAVLEAADASGKRTARWDAALAWCGDAPLEDLCHWPPADGRRAHLQELRKSAIETRWEATLDERPRADLVADLEALVAAEPLRERGWSLLLMAYERAGRRVEDFERSNARVGLSRSSSECHPGPELVERCESLLRDDGPPRDATGGDADFSAPRAMGPVGASDRRSPTGDRR